MDLKTKENITLVMKAFAKLEDRRKGLKEIENKALVYHEYIFSLMW